MKKIDINFPNVADRLYAEMQDKQYRKKAWERKRFYAPDSRFSIFERIALLTGCFVFSIAMICLGIINADVIDNFYEIAITFFRSIPVGAWTVLALCFTFSSLAWFLITRKRARG